MPILLVQPSPLSIEPPSVEPSSVEPPSVELHLFSSELSEDSDNESINSKRS
jgi:hypothetical protein